jgi:hypothetical protein
VNAYFRSVNAWLCVRECICTVHECLNVCVCEGMCMVHDHSFVQARVIEDARHAASGGVNPQGKAISKRPDLVARTKMEKAGATVNTTKVAGHVPGIAIFDRSAFDWGFVACDWGFPACDWAALRMTGASLHVTGAFLHVTGAFSHVTGAFLHVSWAFLHVTAVSLQAFLIGVAIHVMT